MFPTKRILLKEHFRCVEPIIRFSFQFYAEKLIPLRIPKASERLDPPLIDVYVQNGRKDSRQVNVAEADAIVDEIERLAADPNLAKRTIGVVSLIGAKQAHYIQAQLLERIGEEAYLRHDIACGDSATFQGKERDIMFISMVACPLTKNALTALHFQQRFNVALSRARDREYLFRSITEEMLNPEDLKAKVIRHFRAPMGDVQASKPDQIDLCDSGFERDVYKRLSALGYRVTPQVKVGGYSIDLVVEGADDRRLAIELDGDKYHTPDRWADDFARQRVLERVGWRFWRCWGSSFALDPDACMADLVTALKGLGIEPLGGHTTQRLYTEHRVVGSEAKEDTARPAGHPEEGLDTPSPAVRERAAPSAIDRISGKEGLRHEAIVPGLDEEQVVRPGDRVLISYTDEPSRQYTLTLSTTNHDPDHLIINASMPLAQALMGWGRDDEVEIPAGGGTRKVTIVNIDRAAAAGAPA
jgi:very-short-patch-repair endonuclease/transcription elongation GreA/GreB family factor